MAKSYLYGTYGHLADSVVQATADVSTVALYIGTAPINLVRGYADKGLVNMPVRITDNLDAQQKIGTASNWGNYTLAEAVAAHFENANGNVGPIYVINVLDPDTHRKASATTKTLNFVNGRASFESEDIILDTLAIAEKAEGVDYNVSYSFASHKVTILSADEEHVLDGAITVTYYETDTTGIDETDIIGKKTAAGIRTGIQAAELLYQKYDAVANLFAAPGWSDKPEVYKALVAAATKLNGHWDGFVYADIPLKYTQTTYDYVVVASPDTGDDPSAHGWYEHTENSYAVSADTQASRSKTYFNVTEEAAVPEEGDNPAEKGWYEKDGTTYTLTEDTAVDAGKTYYDLTITQVTTINYGANPAEEGWFVPDGQGGYKATTDSQVVPGVTYYEREGGTSTEVVVDTIAKAVAWKAANGYTEERSKIFWPKAQGTDGNVYHLSTLAMAETMRTDLEHGGVPMESCGNKAIPANKQYFGEDSLNEGYSVDEANNLCSNGIDTMVFWGGAWKLWGDHTAAFMFGDEDQDPRDIFDVSMRMLLFLTNRFQRTWAGTVDKPFTVQLKDTILTREQERLDALVTQGALIGSPKIVFEQANNSLDDMKNGNFRWDIQVTPTPPMKSATAYVAYTDAGFSAYFD
jgi:phage tail sheath protein FI